MRGYVAARMDALPDDQHAGGAEEALAAIVRQECDGRRLPEPVPTSLVELMAAEAAHLEQDVVRAAVRERLFTAVDEIWEAIHRKALAGHAVWPDLRRVVWAQLRRRGADRPDLFEELMRDSGNSLALNMGPHYLPLRDAEGRPSAAHLKLEVCRDAWYRYLELWSDELPRSRYEDLLGVSEVARRDREHARQQLMCLPVLVDLTRPETVEHVVRLNFIPPEVRGHAGPREMGDVAAPALGSPEDQEEPGRPDVAPAPARTASVPPAGAPVAERHPGLRPDGDTSAGYVQEVREYLQACVASVRDAMADDRGRPWLVSVLDCLDHDGGYDPDSVRESIVTARGRSLEAAPKVVPPFVNRAVDELRRQLLAGGFLCGDVVESPETLLERPLRLPHALRDDAPHVWPREGTLLALEVRGESLRTIAAAGWPRGRDAVPDWQQVEASMAELHEQRCATRRALHVDAVLCLFEHGLVEPPGNLPASLRVTRGDPGPDTLPHAQGKGRVVAAPRTAVQIEAKPTTPPDLRPIVDDVAGRARPMPTPLRRRHVGTWWFFPEGDVDVR